MSISGSSVPGASCATWPMRVFLGRPIEPVSARSSPVMARNSVVLPVPLRPTSPAFVPAGKRQRGMVEEKASGDAERKVVDDEHGGAFLAESAAEGKGR